MCDAKHSQPRCRRRSHANASVGTEYATEASLDLARLFLQSFKVRKWSEESNGCCCWVWVEQSSLCLYVYWGNMDARCICIQSQESRYIRLCASHYFRKCKDVPRFNSIRCRTKDVLQKAPPVFHPPKLWLTFLKRTTCLVWSELWLQQQRNHQLEENSGHFLPPNHRNRYTPKLVKPILRFKNEPSWYLPQTIC